MRTILVILLIAISPARADQVSNLSELALLPPYCSGTQQIRTISKDPTSIEQYVSIYGEAYRHTHHYCWALNAQNHAMWLRDRNLRESKLRNALRDIQYVLERASDSFSLLPDIYTSRAGIFLALKRDGEAVNDYLKAISLKPDHLPAYRALSDLYVDKGDKSSAIRILEQGIDNTENADSLIKRLQKLGKTYQGIPGNARKKHEDQPVVSESGQAAAQPETTEKEKTPAAPEPVSDESKPNPYCRFCP